MLCTVVNCSGHIDRSSERCGDESRRCHQIDGKQCAFSGHAHDRRNPVDFDKTAGRYFSAVAPSGLTVLGQFLLVFQRAACRIE